MVTPLAVVCGLLAALLLASALLKLSHKPAVVASYARAGVPERWLNALAMLLIAAAGALVAGLFWAPLGIAASAGLVGYFAVAIAFHVRVRDFAPLGMPVLLEALAIVALWLLLRAP
jgi:DoxX-like family